MALLLRSGADVAAVNMNGQTPLHSAALQGHADVVSILVEKGAPVNVKAANGDTPLDAAEYFWRDETAGLLRRHGAKRGNEIE